MEQEFSPKQIEQIKHAVMEVTEPYFVAIAQSFAQQDEEIAEVRKGQGELKGDIRLLKGDVAELKGGQVELQASQDETNLRLERIENRQQAEQTMLDSHDRRMTNLEKKLA